MPLFPYSFPLTSFVSYPSVAFLFVLIAHLPSDHLSSLYTSTSGGYEGHWEVPHYLTFVLFYVVKIHRNDWFLGHIAVLCMYVDMAYCYRPSSVVCQ